MAIIGIDLGTTNSLASVWTAGGVRLIPNAFGEYLTPSVVSFDADGQVYVGKIAKEMMVTNPDGTFSEFKRNMGRKMTYQVPGGKGYTPEELSALVLKQLKTDAEHFLREEITEAIISVPAYFDDNQRWATRAAGKLAGLTVSRLLNEPSAAALSNRLTGTSEDAQVFVVFDFGGGTLDVSVVDAFENIVEIQTVAGNNQLGGKDFNEAIAEYFYRENQLNEAYLSDGVRATVYQEAERCKIALSEAGEVTRPVMIGEKEYPMHMNNQLLIHISKDIFRKMQIPLEQALNNSGLAPEDIDQVILVGGSSKMPIVRHFIKTIFDNEVIADVKPDESIAYGLGVVVGIKSRDAQIKDLILSDICPFTLGVAVHDGTISAIIERNTVLPCSRSEYYETVTDYQPRLTFRVYQGEAIWAGDNLLLTELAVDIPPEPKGRVVARVTFTYDIDGIFDIDVVCLANGEEAHKTIVNERAHYSEAQLKEKRQELNALKIFPRDKEENKLLLAKANRLYEELGKEQKEQLLAYYKRFEEVLNSQKDKLIREEYVRFSLLLEFYEQNKNRFFNIDEGFWEGLEQNFSSYEEGEDS